MSSRTQTAGEHRDPSASTPRLRVAYVMSRFPKISETFVLYEILAVEQAEVAVELYPLQREKTSVMHPEAVPLVERAHFTGWLSVAMIRTHLHYLGRKPWLYLATLWTLLWSNLGSLRYFAGAVAFFPKAVFLARHMARHGIAHVHAHFASHPAAVAYVVHRLEGIPFSFTAHGSDLHRDRHMLREKVARACFVVAISEYNRRLILDDCGPQAAGKVHVIHCGVDTRQFRPRRQAVDSRQQAVGSGLSTLHSLLCTLYCGAGPFSILSIGTVHEVKGQTILADACRILKERGLAFRLHFVGDGPDLSRLRRHVEQIGLADRVAFHGRKTRQEIIELLGGADVLAAPSVPTRDGRREGIPVVLIEAMASGVPVVASRLSGIPELVEDGVNGLLVPPRDAQALAETLARLADDPVLRRELAEAARRRVEHDFDQQVSAAALAARFRMSAARPMADPAGEPEPAPVEVPS
ncbi:MAG: hypothetical protein A2V98_01580 [Planctomycetes bacterium RBG_16_64_12]|nr:MAG: hypothetical protein A2V98_01580 [Planctomycetes bacterium RBG_16_64_12]